MVKDDLTKKDSSLERHGAILAAMTIMDGSQHNFFIGLDVILSELGGARALTKTQLHKVILRSNVCEGFDAVNMDTVLSDILKFLINSVQQMFPLEPLDETVTLVKEVNKDGNSRSPRKRKVCS